MSKNMGQRGVKWVQMGFSYGMFCFSYDIMKRCWEASPKVRPRFADIEAELEAYLEQRSV